MFRTLVKTDAMAVEDKHEQAEDHRTYGHAGHGHGPAPGDAPGAPRGQSQDAAVETSVHIHQRVSTRRPHI